MLIPTTIMKQQNERKIGALFYPTFTGLQDDIMQPTDYEALVKANKSWVYVCINKNSRAVAAQKLRLYVAKTKGKKTFSFVETKPIEKKKKEYIFNKSSVAKLGIVRKAVDIEEITAHPFLDITTNVNNFANATDNWQITQTYLELTGNAYWYLNMNELGIPKEIWTLQSQKMTIIPDEKEFIKGYAYKLNTFNDYETFTPDEIVHFKFPNPDSIFYGLSPLSAVARAYNLNEKMSDYEINVFKNMGRLEGAYTTENRLNDTEFNRLKAEINQKRGVEHVGRSPLLERGVKYQNFALTPRDLNYIQGLKMTREEIFAAFDVPISKITNDAKYSNAEIADYEWMKDGISPRLKFLEEKLNERVLPLYDDNIFALYDDPVQESKDFTLKENVEYVRAGIKTINEVRNTLGLEEIEGLNEPLFPFSLGPLGSSGPQQGSSPVQGEEEESEEKKIIGRITRKVLAKFKKKLNK